MMRCVNVHQVVSYVFKYYRLEDHCRINVNDVDTRK
jgi:hypothetical protein